MELNKFFQSKTLKIILFALSAIVLLVCVFSVGEFVGYRKAGFSYRWGENYHRNFGGPREGFFKDFYGKDYINANGTFGSIMKINGSTLIIKDRDNVEKTIILSDKTTVRSRQSDVKLSDLKVDDKIIIIGSPNEQGQIDAKFIRVFD